MHWVRTIAAVGMLVCGAAPVAANFGPGAGVGQPTLLRLSGFVGSAPADVRTLGQITLGVDHAVVTFALTAVQASGGALIEGRAALRQTELYNPNLRLVGAPALLHTISTAAPQTKLTLFGYLSGNAGRLIVVQIDEA